MYTLINVIIATTKNANTIHLLRQLNTTVTTMENIMLSSTNTQKENLFLPPPPPLSVTLRLPNVPRRIRVIVT